MSGKNAFHLNTLNHSQKKILPALATALYGSDFYLAGGTALAIQVGHRFSIDYDFFAKKVGDPEILLRNLRSAKIDFITTSISHETIYISIDSVQVSFIGYDYSLIKPLLDWPDYNIKLASLDDIACMKISAITSRGSKKNFFDLHYLVENFRPLEEYLRLYTQKFQDRDIGHVIRSLVFFDDAESEPEIQMINATQWNEIKSNFEIWVKQLSSRM